MKSVIHWPESHIASLNVGRLRIANEDFEAFQRLCSSRSPCENSIYRCVDGDHALSISHHEPGRYVTPNKHHVRNLILLDLNLPERTARSLAKS